MSYKRTPWGRLFVGILVVAVGVPCLWFYPRYKLANAFTADQLRRYEDTLGDEPMPKAGDTLPPRNGKVVLVVPSRRKPGGRFPIYSTRVRPEIRRKTKEVEPPRLHDAMFDLDSSLRANSPEEVETIIFCEHYSEKVEDHSRWEDENYEYHLTYEKGRRNGILICVYDLANRQLLGAYDVKGPPARLEGGQYASPDPVDLAETIARMPAN